MLSKAAFIVCADQIQSFLRIPEERRFVGAFLAEKYESLREAFPEVDDRMLIYACEQWMQVAEEFSRFPTWNELMRSLYRCDGNGLPVRHAGFKPTLPPRVQPTPQQLAMLPSRDEIDRTPPGANPEAYRIVSFPRPNGLLPEGYR